MPAAVAVPLITTGISAATSIGSSLLAKGSAKKRTKEAQSLLDNYQRQDIVNPYENIQVSTLSADRQREDLARAIATNTQYAAMGGGRAIAGIAPQLVAQQNTQEAQILANLDEQEKQRQQLIARGDEMVQNMTEQRENNDLMGIGNSLNVARQEGVNAQNNLTSSLMTTGALAMEGARQGLFNGGSNVGVNPLAPQSNIGITSTVPNAGTSVERVLSNSDLLSLPRVSSNKFMNNNFTQPNWLQNYNDQQLMGLSSINPFGMPLYIPKRK